MEDNFAKKLLLILLISLSIIFYYYYYYYYSTMTFGNPMNFSKYLSSMNNIVIENIENISSIYTSYKILMWNKFMGRN